MFKYINLKSKYMHICINLYVYKYIYVYNYFFTIFY